MNRTHNTIRNIAWGGVQKIITLFIPFATRTVSIKILGAEYLGLSSLFTSILGLLSLAELGVSSAIVSSMYKPIADNDTDTICNLMAFYKKTYRVIGFVILAIGLMFTPFIDKFINGSIPSDVSIYGLYLIYLSNTSLSYFLFAYKNCLFIAHQRNDVNSRVSTLSTFFLNMTQIILILFFKSYYLYVIVVPIFSVANNLITAFCADRCFPQYKPVGKLNQEVYSEIKKRIMGLMLGKISNTIRSTIDSIFISTFLGLTTVAMYSNYFYVISAIAGIIQLLDSAMVAGVGNSIAVDGVEKNYHDINKFTFMLQWIVGWCSICILCLIQPFMKVWVGRKYMFNNSMAILCAMYLFVCCIGTIRSIYTQALGMWWQLRYLSIVDIFVNLFLNLILVMNFGAYGVLGATIIDIAFVSIPWTTYYLFRDYFGKERYHAYIKAYIKYFGVAIIIGSVTYFVCSSVVSQSSVVSFVLCICVCLVIPNSLYLLVFWRNNLFKESIQFVVHRVRQK